MVAVTYAELSVSGKPWSANDRPVSNLSWQRRFNVDVVSCRKTRISQTLRNV